MILFGSTISPFVRKVVAFAAEKQVALKVQSVRFADADPAFRAASPFGKMPALDDDGFRLADSSAICHYLEARHPAPPLIPGEARARGKVVWYDEFADTILMDCGRKMFFNRVVSPLFLQRPGDLAAADKAECEELPRLLDYLEPIIPESGFLVEDRITLADIAVASPFANITRHLGVAIDADKYPRVTRYIQNILERPSFKPVIEKETRFLDKVRGMVPA